MNKLMRLKLMPKFYLVHNYFSLWLKSITIFFYKTSDKYSFAEKIFNSKEQIYFTLIDTIENHR